MSFLANYQWERDIIFERIAEFAQKHPEIAERLNLLKGQAPDSELSSLLELFAIITGRLRTRLQNNFTEFGASLLNYGGLHFLRPVPYRSIIQFEPQNQDTLPKNSLVKITDQEIFFSTVYDVELQPLLVQEVCWDAYSNQSLSIKLQSTIAEPIGSWRLNRLRFYISAPLAESFKIYELLNQDLNYISIEGESGVPIFLEKNALRFLSGDLLPYGSSVDLGARLLFEYFSLPQKFFFFEIDQLAANLTGCTHQLLLKFYFSKKDLIDLQFSNRVYFKLNCTPIINLFSRKNEPLIFDPILKGYAPESAVAKSGLYTIQAVNSVDKWGNVSKLDAGQDYQLKFQSTGYEEIIGSYPILESISAELSLYADCLFMNKALPFSEALPNLEVVERLYRAVCIEPILPIVEFPWAEQLEKLLIHLNSLDIELSTRDNLHYLIEIYSFFNRDLTSIILNEMGHSQLKSVNFEQPDEGTISAPGIELHLEVKGNFSGWFLLSEILSRFLQRYLFQDHFIQLIVSISDTIVYRSPPRRGLRPLV